MLFFLYLLVLYINSSVTCLKFAPKWPFSYFQPILAAICVTIATVKVESIPELNTLAIVLINYFFFVFVALRPMSTAMVIAGRSVYLTTLFPGQA